MITFIKEVIFGKDETKDDGLDMLMQTMNGLTNKWLSVGAGIAEDCFMNGLKKGASVQLSEIETLIKKEYGSNAVTVNNGFLKRMMSYIDSGDVINLSIQGGDSAFMHKDHISTLNND